MTGQILKKGVNNMLLSPNFPGQNYPPSTIVSFPTKNGKMTGEVQKLLKKYARVVTDPSNGAWKVPYGIMTVEDRKINPEITLKEIHEFALLEMKEYELDDWKFGFDLAQVRGGVCKHRKKEISLSVSYCCAASREDVLDTVLHEIAHALAGFKVGHGPKWKKICKAIGCSGKVYHTTIHGKDRWEGTCPCGRSWTRMKLSQRSKKYAICPKCDENITWTQIISSS